MSEDFCIFILTHGRPDNQVTLTTLQKAGYDGKVYLVIDDEDAQGDRYRELYGDRVLMFSKEEVSKTFDEGDNFEDRRTITYARNACYDLAKKVGVTYFMQLDDDYSAFQYRYDEKDVYHIRSCANIGQVIEAMLKYYKAAPAIATLAMGQAGDFIGGEAGSPWAKVIKTERKAMNSFICSVDRRIKFVGRMNEDVCTYVTHGSRGMVFLTTFRISLIQGISQANAGGITELYKAYGTYTKAMYTIMMHPSSVRIKPMGWKNKRLHHLISWGNTVPKIISEVHRKP